jgi:glycosyltransferase involved in cell wall biosynthesis
MRELFEMKISVITVSYNSATTIADTVRSVAAQTYSNIEHLVIDGQSKDATVQVVETNRHPNLILCSEPDAGIYDAMNKGITMASGEIIGFINADDFYASSYVFEKIANAFQNPNIDACYGDLYYVGQHDISAIVRYWQSSNFNAHSFESGWCPPHPTFFVRRKIYEQYGLFNLNYKIAADIELMMRYLEVHKIRSIYIPEVLVKMRMGGTTNRSLSNIWKQNKEVLAALQFHGLRASIWRLLGSKFISRGLQFFLRPN